jgi:hypothetical protein
MEAVLASCSLSARRFQAGGTYGMDDNKSLTERSGTTNVAMSLLVSSGLLAFAETRLVAIVASNEQERREKRGSGKKR